MSITELLYKLIIGPLELLFEVIFIVVNRVIDNSALAIIALSLMMNILVLPLYRRADAMQAEERDRENRMRPWIDHIKKTFKGDERFMMLQAYYRQNDYKPSYALKGSVSLLLEVPFFIAAYRFLSGLELLKGVSFGPIADLGVPDAMISIAGVSINVLPILMTTINLAAAAIYMKGMPLKNKVQMIGIAGIFLVLLYKSPAGLVFYWTLNNLFSLGKNIVFKIRENREQKERNDDTKENAPVAANKSGVLFWTSAAALAIISGLLIPSALINDNVEEFLDVTEYFSPNWYLVSAIVLAIGTFFIWMGTFYKLVESKWKNVIAVTASVAVATGLCNYMFFSNKFGNISAELEYDSIPEIAAKTKMINIAVTIVIASIVILLYKHKRGLLTRMMTVTCMALIIMSGINVANANSILSVEKEKKISSDDGEPEFVFSTQGRNVVVIMMDRMPGFYIPYVMNEKPELKEQYKGFTYYSNAISYADTTNEGSPPIYGGYDYTPQKMNEREDKLLVEKHNAALKLMPTLFGNEGYDVTICNPTYAGYKFIPDLTVFDDHPEYHTYLLNNRYSLPQYGYYSSATAGRKARLRNFFCYSIFRMSPSVVQRTLYQRGAYNSSDTGSVKTKQAIEGTSIAHGYRSSFMSNYAALCNFPNMSKIEENGTNHFLMLSNDATHETMLMQEPEYLPAMEVDNREYDAKHPNRADEHGNVIEFEDREHRVVYHTTMTAMMALGEWLDYLKQNNVYENTRIIIVSDHGPNYLKAKNKKYALKYVDEDSGKSVKLDTRKFGCTLLYKDFDAEEFTVNDIFTTNADTPALAMAGIVDNPVNPDTGNPVTLFDESKRPIYAVETKTHKINANNGNKFLKSRTFQADGPIDEIGSWSYVGNW